MELQENYYEMLGVAPDASQEAIERAYRALALRWHPDLTGPTGEAQMRRLNAAAAALRDPVRRRAYNSNLGLLAGRSYDVPYTMRVSAQVATWGGVHRTPFCGPDGDPLLIPIPSGSADGDRWRVVGRGACDRAGRRGDLMVTLQIALANQPPLPSASTLRRLLDQIYGWTRRRGGR
jgi:DnaJ-class molecular chaperone